MGRYLRSYKKYPAGSLIVVKKYSLWKRFLWLFKKERKPYNSLFLLTKESCIGITKMNKFKYDYHLFIPIKPYTRKEIVLLRSLIKSCESIEDYLTAINIVRPDSVDATNLDNLRNNTNYKKVYLEQEPFQDINISDDVTKAK